VKPCSLYTLQKVTKKSINTTPHFLIFSVTVFRLSLGRFARFLGNLEKYFENINFIDLGLRKLQSREQQIFPGPFIY
jgi:hypothetical protein